MSKQSEAKERQGYTTQTPCCKRCAQYRSEFEELSNVFSGQAPYIIESHKRCSIGEFKVISGGWCNEFERKA